MKALRVSVAIAMMIALFISVAIAESDGMFSIIETILSQSDQQSPCFSVDEARRLLSTLSAAGYTVPADIDSDSDHDFYKYEFTMDLLESELGDWYSWTIEDQYRFSALMVACGQLDYCFNLLPDENEISREQAQELALEAIVARDSAISVNDVQTIDVSYRVAHAYSEKGMWCFGITFDNSTVYEVEITGGAVSRCYKRPAISELEQEFTALQEEKGGFFTWSLQDKMEFARSLPPKLDAAKRGEALLMSDVELDAIVAYGFCLPTEEQIPQEEALALAIKATQETFSLEDGWDANAEIYYSFFYRNETGYVWRVIFWNVGNERYLSGIVDLNATTGEILAVRKSGGTFEESIPYIERL